MLDFFSSISNYFNQIGNSIPSNAIANMPSWAPTCNSWLPNLINTNPSLFDSAINACRTNRTLFGYKLTPVHLAVLNDDLLLLEALHKNGANIDQPDKLGYTPLHHMAMKGNITGVYTLLAMGANPEHRNKMGGTYADLLRFNQPYRKSAENSLNSTLFSAHQNDKVYVDPKCIPKGVTYVDENVLKPKQLFQMWKEASKSRETALTDTQKKNMLKYAAFKVSPPKLSVEPITHDDSGNKIDVGTSFCGVIAKEPIKKGDPIAEYVGEMFIDRQPVDTGYTWLEEPAIDSKEFRSAASMINHAFPNAEMNLEYVPTGKGVDGLPQRKIITAIQDIDEGEQITIHYGPKYYWKQPPIEMRPNSVIKFMKKNSWDSLLRELFNFMEYQKGDASKLNQFLSILNSTENLIALVNERLLTLKDFKKIKEIYERLPSIEPDVRKIELALAQQKKAAPEKGDL